MLETVREHPLNARWLAPRDRQFLRLLELSQRRRYPNAYRYARKHAEAEHGPVCGVLPRTANEKFLWRKLFDRNPEIALNSDKLAVKDFVRGLCPGIEAAEVLWTGQDPEDIPDALLEQDVVVKCNHAWNDKSFARDYRGRREALNTRMRGFMRSKHYLSHDEWGYRNITPTLFVERVLGTPSRAPVQFNIFYFGQVIERIGILTLRDGVRYGATLQARDDGVLDPNRIKPDVVQELYDEPIPPTFYDAIEAGRVIARRFDHVRVDFMTDGKTLWIGELTFYNQGGMLARTGNAFDSVAARFWDLRRSHFLGTARNTGILQRYADLLRQFCDRDCGPPAAAQEIARIY